MNGIDLGREPSPVPRAIRSEVTGISLPPFLAGKLFQTLFKIGNAMGRLDRFQRRFGTRQLGGLFVSRFQGALLGHLIQGL